MEIRNAVEADLPAIVAIYNTTIASRSVTADQEPVLVESRLEWFRSHTPARRPLWVVEFDGAVVGWLGFQSFYGRPAYDATVELSIYIDPHHRRKGIGRLLMRWAIAHCPSLGIKTLLGFIFASNQPSLTLFEQFGFQRWGYLPGVAAFDTGTNDLVILGLSISPALSQHYH